MLAPCEADAPFRLRRLVISTIIAIALVSHTALTSLHAQAPPIYSWAETGTVELSRSMSATAGMRNLDLTIREGESATYYLRLSEQPEASGWWVRVHVDGVVYTDGVLEEKGIRWVPSVGWQVNRDGSGATPWRSVTIYATEDNDTDDELVNVTHEVWDESTNCPPSLHGIAPITVRIIDDDEPPGLSIDDAPVVREGDTAEFVVRLSASSDTVVTVAYETMDGTAVAGSDYTSTTGTLRFDAGETRRTIAVPTIEDATAEETEGFTVQLRDPSGATVADGTATGTITDDDEPPGLSIDDAPVVREGDTAEFVVRLSASSDTVVTVAYETMDGTAVAGSDYTSTAGTLRFDAGETRKTIAVPTIEDATAEETEGFTVQLRDPSGATVADGTATGTITDDDEPPGLSIDDAPVVREGDTAEFVVRLSASSDTMVTVAYETMDGTAVAGSDYTSTAGTLRFDAGETRKTIAVPTIEDATAEETEGFTVQLRDPSGATVADGTATGTITDDDEPPGLSIDDAPVVREGDTAEFVVRLSASSDTVVTVAYETMDGTAVAGSDYTSTAGTLRFDAGETRKTIAVPTIEDATAEETEGFTVQLRDPSGATVADGTATGTITDDDEPPGLSIDDAPVVREGDTAEFVVRLSASSDTVVTVAYETMDGTAVAGSDYTSTAGTLRFDASETRKTIAVPTIEDATAEETEGFTVQLRDPSGATVADGTATGTITDDDEPPGLSIDDAPVVREGDTAEFVVRLSASSDTVVTVAYETMDGTAVAGSDYTSTTGTLRFDAGETRRTIAVPTIEDATAEETEGFTVQLRDPSGATVADGTATGTITDDDEPPGLSIDDAPVVREGDTAEFVVRLSASSDTVVTVAYETMDGTAVAGSDYTSTAGTLRFDAGETRKTIAVPTIEDATAEETEGFTVQLRDPSGATVADGTATGTITDDDEPPGLSIDDAPVVREGDTAEFVVRLSASSDTVVTVAYETMDGTAVAGSDYTSTAGTLRFDAGETRKTIAVPTIEDATAEETEGFTVQLRDPSGATVADGTATGTITDDDEPPGLSIDDAPVVREGDTAEFVVRLSASSDTVVTVAYETMDGTAVAGSDYTSTAGTLRFDAGETRKTIAVPTIEDATAEETEGFTVQLRDPSGATVADGTATGTITDDDEPPGLSIDDAPVVREGDTAEFVVRLSASSDTVVTVAYETMDGTAVAGSDYTSTAGTLRFDAGETRKTIAVPTIEDATAEETEGFTVQLRDPSGATVADGTATGTITDDDEPPGLSIDDAPVVREGDTAEFVVRLSASSDTVVTVAYETMDGTAVAGSDYTSTAGTLRFDAGETRKTIAVPTIEDATAEETEGFTVQLRDPSGATVADGTATGTITDDDEPPGLSIDDAPVVREGDTAEFVVRLSASSDTVVTVAYETMDGTAVAGSDYTSTTGTLRFDAGETRKTIAVPTIEDATAEETEGFTVQLRDPSGATVADGTATGTITDDDEPPGLSIDDAPVVREGDTAEFVVRLSASSDTVVTVAYETMDGTAVAGSDYTSTTGTLRFDAGETRKTIAVPTIEDATAEETEGFTVQLRDPSGATVADGTATGTITDDDEPPGLSIDDAPVVREGDTAEFVVRLSASSDTVVTVAYETMDGTAVAGSDYTSTAGTLRFDAGETRKTIAVPTIEDATAEETEGFTVQLRDPSGATVADGTATGTITDDDEPPGLSIDDAPVVREGDTAEFVVRLSASSDTVVTVAYETMDGTAVAGSDYTSTAGTLRFDAGETRKTIAVPTIEDATAEETEGFTVQLRDPSGATVADGTATGTITDDVQQRIVVVNDVVLPEVGRALAFSAVRCRIDQVLSGSALRGKSTEPSAHLALSPEARSGRGAAPGVQSPTLVQAFDDSLFLMQSQEEKDGGGRFAAWWCPDYQNLGGGDRGGGISWDGDVSSWHAGADARIGPGLLAGVSFSRSRGSFDYQGGGRNLDTSLGTYELGLVSIHPYLVWSVLPNLDVWGTVGHAWGDLRVVDVAAGNVLTSPATLDSGVVGVSGRLLTRGATTLRLKGEWALAQMHVARASTAFDAAPVDMQRLRMGAEVSYQHALSSGTSLIPWGEVGLRHDGGDGEIGAGLELGGGLRHLNREAGLTVEGHGRWLLIHRGTLREWGLGGLVRFAPKAGSRWPSVSLMPTWGDSASGVQELWERGATDLHLHSAPGARLDAEFGYGFGALRNRGVLTPYIGLSLVGEAARGYRLGGRLAVGQSVTVSLEAKRRQHLADARIHALLLLGTLQF